MGKTFRRLAFIASLTVVAGNPVWGSYIIPSGSITTVKIASQAVTQPKLAPRAEVTPSPSTTPAASGSIAVSPSCGTFSTSSASFVIVTNLEIGLTTTGRPVEIELMSDSSSGYLLASSSTTCAFEILSGSTAISVQLIGSQAVPASSIRAIDYPAAGNQIYSVKVEQATGSGSCGAQSAVLVAHEM